MLWVAGEAALNRRNIWCPAGDDASPRVGGAKMGWTDERVETLKKLWLDGLSASQIAKQLRVTPPSCFAI